MNIFQVYFTKNRLLLKTLTQPNNLTIILAVATCIWVAMFFIVYFFNNPQERNIVISKIIPSDPSLSAGIIVNEFNRIEFENETFSISGILWFEYDPKVYTKEEFTGFKFENGNITFKSEPIFIKNNDLERIVYRFFATISSRVNFVDFPLDKHRLDFVITDILKGRNKTFTYATSRARAEPFAFKEGWTVYDHEIRSGLADNSFIIYGHRVTEQFDHRLIFSLFVKRDSIKVALLSLMPLLLIFLIGLISLTFDVTNYFNAILSLAVGSLTGFLFFRGVLDRLIPPTNQFTIVDRVYILMIMLMVLILGVQIYILHYFSRLQAQTQLTQLLERYTSNINITRGALFIVFIIVFLLLTTFVFF